MEGDIKDIVLARLEKRLKEKDEEIHSLKSRLEPSSPQDGQTLKEMAEKVDVLELKVHETQIIIGEMMKKVGALESTLNTLLAMSAPGLDEDGMPEGDLSMGGAQVPLDLQSFDKFAADPNVPESDQKGNIEDSESKDGLNNGHKNNDSLRFFHIARNS